MKTCRQGSRRSLSCWKINSSRLTPMDHVGTRSTVETALTSEIWRKSNRSKFSSFPATRSTERCQESLFLKIEVVSPQVERPGILLCRHMWLKSAPIETQRQIQLVKQETHSLNCLKQEERRKVLQRRKKLSAAHCTAKWSVCIQDRSPKTHLVIVVSFPHASHSVTNCRRTCSKW